jgi:ATP-dependent Zn protease
MTPPGRSIPYSEFKQLVKNGEVAEISIGDQAIRGTLRAGDAKTRAFTVTRVEDP